MRFQHNPFTDKLDISGVGPGGTVTEFLTGNDGIPVPSDASYNINVLGNNTQGINITGNAGTSTLTVAGINASTSQIGVQANASNAQAAAQSASNVSLTPSNITSLFSTNPLPASQGGTGLSSPAAHQLLATNGSSAFTPLGVAANGAIPIGSVGNDPVLNTITPGTGVTVTNGPGTITIGLTGGGVSIDTILTDDGAPGVVPDASGNISIIGGTGMNVTGQGPGNTVTVTLETPVTVSNGGTGVGTITGLLAGNGTSNLNGRTITAGTGINITNGDGSTANPVINAVGSGLTWSAITADQTLAINNGYVVTSGTLSLALPTTAAVGSIIELTLDGGTSWTVTQGSGKQIRFGNTQTTSGAGGSLASTAAGDTIRMVCSVANNKWNVLSSIGNITVV